MKFKVYNPTLLVKEKDYVTGTYYKYDIFPEENYYNTLLYSSLFQILIYKYKNLFPLTIKALQNGVELTVIFSSYPILDIHPKFMRSDTPLMRELQDVEKNNILYRETKDYILHPDEWLQKNEKTLNKFLMHLADGPVFVNYFRRTEKIIELTEKDTIVNKIEKIRMLGYKHIPLIFHPFARGFPIIWLIGDKVSRKYFISQFIKLNIQDKIYYLKEFVSNEKYIYDPIFDLPSNYKIRKLPFYAVISTEKITIENSRIYSLIYKHKLAELTVTNFNEQALINGDEQYYIDLIKLALDDSNMLENVIFAISKFLPHVKNRKNIISRILHEIIFLKKEVPIKNIFFIIDSLDVLSIEEIVKNIVSIDKSQRDFVSNGEKKMYISAIVSLILKKDLYVYDILSNISEKLLLKLFDEETEKLFIDLNEFFNFGQNKKNILSEIFKKIAYEEDIEI